MNRRTKSIVFCSVFLVLAFSLAPLSAIAGTDQEVESETGFYYTVQKGDTLWDLQQRFSDSAWLWPELWEENDQIANPHWIFPGERIRLYKKAGKQAVGETDTRPTPSLAVADPAMKRPPKKTNEPFFFYPAIDRIGFIRKPRVEPIGTIFKVQETKQLISEGDIVYIRPSDTTPSRAFIPGSQHTVFRYLEPTAEKDVLETIGTQHYILGVVEVTQQEPDMVLAKVVKSFRSIKIDDMLMPFNQHPPQIEMAASTPDIDGKIIASEEHTMLTGEYMLAFIDKGEADNIKVGQSYSIYRQDKTGYENKHLSDTLLPPVDFGTLMVLHTEKTTSTVVITKASTSIAPGERFRTPVN